jgi:hypothetical protein
MRNAEFYYENRRHVGAGPRLNTIPGRGQRSGIESSVVITIIIRQDKQDKQDYTKLLFVVSI